MVFAWLLIGLATALAAIAVIALPPMEASAANDGTGGST